MKRALIFSCVIISESDENHPTIVYQRRRSTVQKLKKKKKKIGRPKGFLKTVLSLKGLPISRLID